MVVGLFHPQCSRVFLALLVGCFFISAFFSPQTTYAQAYYGDFQSRVSLDERGYASDLPPLQNRPLLFVPNEPIYETQAQWIAQHEARAFFDAWFDFKRAAGVGNVLGFMDASLHRYQIGPVQQLVQQVQFICGGKPLPSLRQSARRLPVVGKRQKMSLTLPVKSLP